MRTDKSIIRLMTYKAKEYHYKKSLGLNCRILCQQDINKISTDTTKHELFFKIYDLGKSLFDEINDLTINISIHEYYNKKFEITDYSEIIEDEFFINLREKINNSKSIKKILLSWYEEFGIYDLNDMIVYSIKGEKNITKIYKSDCLELANFALIIYIIYSVNKIIKSANDIPLLKKLINVFPILQKDYKEYGLDQDNANHIMKYILEIINKINIGIDNLFFDFANYINYTYDINSEFPTSLEELEDITDNKYKIELIKNITIVTNPIYFAWQYLLKLLTIDNYDDGYYWCENCNEILSSNTVLCYSCKKALGNKFLTDNIKNIELKNEIEKELSLDNYINPKYPKGPIVRRYQDLKKHTKYNKKRSLQ